MTVPTNNLTILTLFWLVFYFLLLLPFNPLLKANGSNQGECTYIQKVSSEICGSRRTELRRFDQSTKNRIYIINESLYHNSSTEGCYNDIHDSPCRRVLQVGRIKLQSFGAKTRVHISDMLRHCCGNCTRYYRSYIRTPLYDADRSLLEKYDVIYPVPAKPWTRELYGFYFIPVFNIPNAYYFTLKITEKDIMIHIINDLLNMWPLLAMCLLMSLIAGFICWISDTWSNVEHFPRSFVHGLSEGFWWSFVSMTTVGYGDKVPKTIMARLFAVAWILIGLTISSIYIAAITTEMLSVHFHDDSLKGKKVGVLDYNQHDSIMVSELGGSHFEMKYNDTIIGITNLMKKLERKEIDGFLVNSALYYYYARVLKELVLTKYTKYRPYEESTRHIETVQTEVGFSGEPLVSGMLIKHEHDYFFFKKYFENNWIQIQCCYSFDLNYEQKKFKEETLVPWYSLFLPVLYVLMAVIVAILVFGVVFELRRRRRVKQREPSSYNGVI